MNIRLVCDDKPLEQHPMMVLGENLGSEKIQTSSVAQTTAVDPLLRHALDTVDDLAAKQTPLTIQSLDVGRLEASFPKPFSTGDSSDSNDTDMSEEEQDRKNYNIASNPEKSLGDRCDAARAIDRSCAQLKSDAYFSIATQFTIDTRGFSYVTSIARGNFLPLEAAKRMTQGNTTYDSRKQALAFYSIALNPAVPAKFRYEAMDAISCGDDDDCPYKSSSIEACFCIAEDDQLEPEYRVGALRKLKNDNGFIDKNKLADMSHSIAEGWQNVTDQDKNWQLFEDLYKLDADEENEWIPDEYLENNPISQQQPIDSIQITIVNSIINNFDLDQAFRIRVVQEKLQGHDYQQQALENTANGQYTDLLGYIHSTKPASSAL